jgi:hypothetical protein
MRYVSTKLPINSEQVLAREIQKLSCQVEKIAILDIGAGPGKIWEGAEFENLFDSQLKVTLLDASNELLSMSNKTNQNLVRMTALIPRDLSKIPDNAYNCVIAFDVIEHLNKEDGYILLYEMDRIAKELSIILTPNSFVWQPPSINNPYNAHISGWKPQELSKLGWTIQRGQAGFKYFYGPYGLTKKKNPNWSILEIHAAMKILSYMFPRMSFSFLAIKRLKNKRIELQA